ncbi:hypothetical protein [Nostoc sp. UHCC 0252]|uniref:hypothetical protein n=1 Tax=Nostoc sp. UHCC 0252 TaxID=3110241 RepID=UPI002B1F6A45|nr:hypothetical protein [Nostoc sp. UHCC 0252]MEA5602677.1 hypothetical protein [Nostoc sp. UHCC 0252]
MAIVCVSHKSIHCDLRSLTSTPFSKPGRVYKKAIALSQQRQKCDRYILYFLLND